jgi:hypothetical protein
MTKRTKDLSQNSSEKKIEGSVPGQAIQEGLQNLADMAQKPPEMGQGEKPKRGPYRKKGQVELFESVPLNIDPRITGQLLVVFGGIVARVRHEDKWKPIESEILQFGEIANAVLGRYLPDPAKTHKELVSLLIFCLGYTMTRLPQKEEKSSSPESLEEMKEKVHTFNA